MTFLTLFSRLLVRAWFIPALDSHWYFRSRTRKKLNLPSKSGLLNFLLESFSKTTMLMSSRRGKRKRATGASSLISTLSLTPFPHNFISLLALVEQVSRQRLRFHFPAACTLRQHYFFFAALDLYPFTSSHVFCHLHLLYAPHLLWIHFLITFSFSPILIPLLSLLSNDTPAAPCGSRPAIPIACHNTRSGPAFLAHR